MPSAFGIKVLSAAPATVAEIAARTGLHNPGTLGSALQRLHAHRLLACVSLEEPRQWLTTERGHHAIIGAPSARSAHKLHAPKGGKP